MFYYVTLTQNIDLEPRWFGKQLHRTLKQKLVEKVEGTCTGKYGYIVTVVDVGEISKGKIRQDGSGLATFRMTFSCLAFRPFKEEVVDAVVESVSKMGFFGRVGPMSVFVSSNLMPQEYEYSSAGEASFEAPGHPPVTEGAQCRVKVMGVRMDATELFCVCTMQAEMAEQSTFLGVLENAGVA